MVQNMSEKNKKGHVIKEVLEGSIAAELEIAPGDKLLSIGGNEIEDIFDYQYYVEDGYIEVLIEKPDGEQWENDALPRRAAAAFRYDCPDRRGRSGGRSTQRPGIF